MEPIRHLKHHALPRWPHRLDPQLQPVEPIDLVEKARRNAEQIGDLSRLRRRESLLQEELRRETWKEIYDREVLHQQRLFALLREAQDTWFEAFQASYKKNQEAFDRICRMWSDYFNG